MVPTSFDHSNAVLGKPEGWADDECEALSVLRTQTDGGRPVVISCWKLTKDEVDELLRTGRVWLLIMGLTMPPVSLTVERPFNASV